MPSLPLCHVERWFARGRGLGVAARFFGREHLWRHARIFAAIGLWGIARSSAHGSARNRLTGGSYDSMLLRCHTPATVAESESRG